MDDFFKDKVRKIINDGRYDDRQRMAFLASCAEGEMDYPSLSSEATWAMREGVICDLKEGAAPHRPRYVLPDYDRALLQGCSYLELDPPTDFDEAVQFLTLLYTRVPSITGYPVYLGDVDQLLEPFSAKLTDAELHQKIRLFWRAIDRLLPDSFVHANIGPKDGRVARAILAAERELRQVVPNLTLKYDPEITSNEFLHDAIATVFTTAKPHFGNHRMMVADLGENYGVVSCYNSLIKGGGAHTLVRLNLHRAVQLSSAQNCDEFVKKDLSLFVDLTLEVIAARIRYLVDEAGFFKHNFLAIEGLIDLKKFSAMFGLFGMAEAVNLLLEREAREDRYGHSEKAQSMALLLLQEIRKQLLRSPLPHCEGGGGYAFLHAQSGIDSDINITPGLRIPFGDEPDLIEHILWLAPFHRYFSSGISDIFHFDNTAGKNIPAVARVIQGAFLSGMREFTFNLIDNEFVRITGYIIRRSSLDKVVAKGDRILSTFFGQSSSERNNPSQRKVRVFNHEQSPRFY